MRGNTSTSKPPSSPLMSRRSQVFQTSQPLGMGPPLISTGLNLLKPRSTVDDQVPRHPSAAQSRRPDGHTHYPPVAGQIPASGATTSTPRDTLPPPRDVQIRRRTYRKSLPAQPHSHRTATALSPTSGVDTIPPLVLIRRRYPSTPTSPLSPIHPAAHA